MRRGADRLNRVLLSLIGALLSGLGMYGLLRGAGAVGGSGTEPVISPWLRSEAGERQVLLLGVLGAAAVLAIWLGLWWLTAQLPQQRSVGRIALPATEHATRVDVSARAITDALAADIRQLGGVADASARIVGEQPLSISLDVSLEEGADLTAVSEAIAGRPKRRLQEALEVPDVDLRARLRLAPPAPRRVA
ncbi:MAG: hypothetical protein ABIS47_04210 [Acidimicrobiales bacterium]